MRSGLLRRLSFEAAFINQPLDGSCLAAVGLGEPRSRFLGDRGYLSRKRARSPARLGLPPWQRRCHARRGLDHQPVLRDPQDAPRHRAERENIMARGLLREILLDIAYFSALRLNDDVIVAAFRNRPARSQRGKACAAAWPHAAGRAIVKYLGRGPRNTFRRGGSHRLEQALELIGFEGGKTVGAAQNLEQFGVADILFFSGYRDDLLGQHVHAQGWHFDRVHSPVTNRMDGGGAFNQVIEIEREETPFRHCAWAMARTPDTLNRGRDPFRRVDLADEIDGTDINA